MKKIMVAVQRLQCEQCDFMCENQYAMEEHEKSHLQDSCQHTSLEYSVSLPEDCDGIVDIWLKCKCKTCNLQAEIPLPKYNQPELARIFNAAGGMDAFQRVKVKVRVTRETWEKIQADFKAKYGREMSALEVTMFRPQPD